MVGKTSATEILANPTRLAAVKLSIEKLNRKPLKSGEEKTMNAKETTKKTAASTKTASKLAASTKKPETTAAKAPAKAPAKKTEAPKATPLELARAARPLNTLGHVIGSQSDALDTKILTGKATIASLEKMLVKDFGMKEKAAGYRVKSHLEHLEAVKKCKIHIDKTSQVITLNVPKTTAKAA